MRCIGLLTSDDVVAVVAMISDEVVFDFEVFPPMVFVSEEFKVDCMYCFNGEYIIIDKGHVRAYLYKRLVLFFDKFYSVIFYLYTLVVCHVRNFCCVLPS